MNSTANRTTTRTTFAPTWTDRRRAQERCERFGLRMLAYCAVLTVLGLFVGACTNNRWLMVLGAVPGLATLAATMCLSYSMRYVQMHKLNVIECERIQTNYGLIVACGCLVGFWALAFLPYFAA